MSTNIAVQEQEPVIVDVQTTVEPAKVKAKPKVEKEVYSKKQSQSLKSEPQKFGATSLVKKVADDFKRIQRIEGMTFKINRSDMLKLFGKKRLHGFMIELLINECYMHDMVLIDMDSYFVVMEKSMVESVKLIPSNIIEEL